MTRILLLLSLLFASTAHAGLFGPSSLATSYALEAQTDDDLLCGTHPVKNGMIKPNSSLELVARPASTVDSGEPIVAYLFRDGERVGGEIPGNEYGVVFTGFPKLAVGTHEIVIIVGRKGHLPSSASAGPAKHYAVLRLRVRVCDDAKGGCPTGRATELEATPARAVAAVPCIRPAPEGETASCAAWRVYCACVQGTMLECHGVADWRVCVR